ncbi:ABC transporter permease [Fusibacter bizertensis]|uniref:ABC transporter permease n=1 Tax=Fusibacter bizertensis TaxID=1488331 RepID=A0ABT6NGL0_9FIRM|nr:ABC transporter permease [Fusibacter bizertensis]MDH8679480.1 ABC transporter permease [Fusibacter bizertensis]
MWKFIMKSLFAIVILLTVTMITFFFMDMRPVKAEERALNKTGVISQAKIELQKEALGYNDPIHTRYLRWLGNVFKGDLGYYYDRDSTVNNYLFIFMGRSLLLNGVAFIVSLAISIPLGILAAMKARKASDTIILVLTMIFTSVPSFYFGVLIILYFVKYVPGLLPISGIGDVLLRARGYPNIWVQITDTAHHMVLPVLSISVVWIGTMVPFIRHAMLDVIHQDYVRTAKSKGLTNFAVFFKHTFRNALLPLISVASMLLPTLIISNILVEKVFSWPGMGMLFIESLNFGERDMVIAITLFYAILVIAGNFISDALYVKSDARIKEGIS